MTTPSPHDLPPQLAANRRYWTGWAGADPDADLTVYRSDIPHSLLNGVLRVSGRPLEEAVAEAKQRLAGSKWLWWVGADSDDGTAEGLIELGAQQVSEVPVMAMDVTGRVEVDPPADLKINTVGPLELPDYVAAYAQPLGFEEGELDPVVERELNFGYPDMVRLAGTIDGKTVGTCTVLLAEEVAGLFCIATDRDHRKRGIATALTLEALRIARDSGRRIATLQASSLGVPVYRAVGFETVSSYRLFAFSE